MRPEDTIHLQVDLLSRIGSDEFADLIVGTLGPVWEKAVGVWAMQYIPELVRAQVATGTAFHVSEDMVTLAEHASTRLRDDDTYRTDIVPAPSGFMVLDRPLSVTDLWGNQMLPHVITWSQVAVLRVKNEEDSRRWRETGRVDRDALGRDGNLQIAGTMVTMWNDLDRQPDFYGAKILREVDRREFYRRFGRWSLIGAELLKDEIAVGPPLFDPREIPDRTPADARPFTNTYRIIVALFELLNQTVVTTETRRAPKTTQKRAARAGLPSGDVQVVTLRRRSVGDPDRMHVSRDVDWSHRWVVDGHWHRYRVGPGRRNVVRRWVNNYVKGPDDKPLVIKKKIFDLRR